MSRIHGSGPEPFDACPDGGRCWHGCPGTAPNADGQNGLPCYRVRNAAPFTDTYPGDGDWPAEIQAEHLAAEVAALDDDALDTTLREHTERRDKRARKLTTARKRYEHDVALLRVVEAEKRTRTLGKIRTTSPSRSSTVFDDDPNTWPEAQRRLLRFVRDQGGWFTSWDGAPTRATRGAVSSRVIVRWQREHLLHEPPWYSPATDEGRDRLLALAALLTDPADQAPVR